MSMCFSNVTRCTAVYRAVEVIPFEMDAAEERAFAIDGYIIVFLESADEMLNIVFSNKLDSKIINDERTGWVSCLKRPGI